MEGARKNIVESTVNSYTLFCGMQVRAPVLKGITSTLYQSLPKILSLYSNLNITQKKKRNFLALSPDELCYFSFA